MFTYITTQLLTPLLSCYPIPDNNPDLKLSTSELKSLIRFATAQTHKFLFKGSFYDQVEGVAMPWIPLHLETAWLEKYTVSKVVLSTICR